MIRKTLTILSLIGLLLSVGLWGASYYRVLLVLPSLRHKIHLSQGAVTLQALIEPTMPDDWLRLARQRIANTPAPMRVRIGVGNTSTYTWTANGAVREHYTFFYPGHTIDGFRSLSTLWTFRYRRIDAGSRTEMIELRLPLWILTVAFLVYPVYLLTPLHRRRKRKKLGQCVKCGYDLRASKERCPECGTAIDAPTAKAEC